MQIEKEKLIHKLKHDLEDKISKHKAKSAKEQLKAVEMEKRKLLIREAAKKQLRDEAHRFAITFQRQKRTKGVAKSKFEDVPGVGKKTVEKIYKGFQNTSDMKDLSDKALAYKLGVSQKIAREIKKIV